MYGIGQQIYFDSSMGRVASHRRLRSSSSLWKNRLMKRPFTATVWREGNWYVSQCLEVDIASQGETEEEALANLKEALELRFCPDGSSTRGKSS